MHIGNSGISSKSLRQAHEEHVQVATCRGLELLEVAEFPAQAPEVRGTSLLFNIDGADAHTLLELPLPALRQGSSVVVRLGVTRERCARDCVAEPNAMAPAIGLSDGINVVAVDAVGVGTFVGVDYHDDGGRLSRISRREVGLLVAPSPGQTFIFEARFLLGRESTSVQGRVSPYSGEYRSSRALDGNRLGVVLIGGVSGAGAYLLDWLSLGRDPSQASSVCVDDGDFARSGRRHQDRRGSHWDN